MPVPMGQAANTLGTPLDSTKIQAGLKELNPDFAFDVVVNRPGDWESVIQFPSREAMEAMQKNRIPVLYNDTYICPLDRGVVPEFKQWSVREAIVEIPWYEADKDEASIQYRIVQPWEPNYNDLYLLAAMGSDPAYQIMGGGLYRMQCVGYRKVPYKVIAVGWRHSFEKILHQNIPGVTREILGAKFRVDLMKYPVGSPEELIATLVAE